MGTIPFVKTAFTLGLLVRSRSLDGLQGHRKSLPNTGAFAEFNPDHADGARSVFDSGCTCGGSKAFAIAVVILTLHRIRPKVLLRVGGF